jgi:hypothetical protein
VGCGFRISIYWIYVRRCLQSLITLLIASHEPATSPGMNYCWVTAVTITYSRLVLMTSYSRLLQTPIADSSWWTPNLDLFWWTAITTCSSRLPWPDCSDKSESESDVTTDSQSASLSWNKAPSGAYDQIFIWRVPAEYTKDRPVLSSERTPT